MRSVRLAFRTLFKSPFVTAVAIISLALGIGANAAIYSLFDQLLLAPLPVHQPERLANLAAPGPKAGSTSCNNAGDCDVIFSYPMFRDLEKAQTGFSSLAAHRLFSANIAYDGETLNGEGVMVSGSYFGTLGLQPHRGRLLTPADDETVGAHFVAVLSHAFWESRLGGDPDVVGRTIIVNGHPFTIIGIAPAGFNGTTVGSRPVVFVPITMRGVVNPGFAGFENRRSYWVYVFGRLKEGVTLEQAKLSINAVYRPIINDVEVPLQQGMLSEQWMNQFRSKEVEATDGRRGQSSVSTEVRTPMLLLMGTTLVVLLIACANIANLLLARGANRGMEMAVRLSIGANRRQVISQLLTESVLLGAMGAVGGVVVAWWTLSLLGSMLPPEAVQSLELSVSGRVITVAAVLGVATGLLFGIFPALHSTRSDLVTTIRANAGNLTVTRAAARFRASLVTAQVALSIALLILAGLFMRSLVNIGRVDLGLRTENIVTFGISPQLNGYSIERSHQLFQRVEEELAALPGVISVSSALVPVLAGSSWGSDVSVEGFERGPDIDANARMNVVGPGYFTLLDVPVLAGREFTEQDAMGGRPVAVVNEAFLRKFNLDRDAVGKRMSDRGTELDTEIIGIVRDSKYNDVKDDVPPMYFKPWRQQDNVGALTFYVRTGADSEQVMRAIQPALARIDPNLPVENLKSLVQQVRENVFLDRVIGTLSAAFAGLATLLAAVGLYGVLAYTVERRTREIGVRMALGADASRVRLMVLRQVAVITLIGSALGLIAAWAVGRVMGSVLYQVEGADPIVFAAAFAVLSTFALAAGYFPALRASRVDPLSALRYD
jgi:predicted permease